VKRFIEGGDNLVLIGCEGNVGRHIEDNLVAVARNRYASATKRAAQFGLLLVHVTTNGTTRKSAYASTDQRIPPVISAGKQSDPCARESPDGRTTGSVGELLLTCVRIGCATCDKGDRNSTRDQFLH